MDKLDKNHLQKFIEDTYVYLNNQQAISNETYENDITDQYSIKNLLQRCKQIMDKLKHEIDNDSSNAASHSIGDDLEEDCYLEMNSKPNDNEYMTFCTNNNNNDDEADKSDPEIQSISNADDKLLEIDDDIDDNGESISCPYSGLPAAHLIIKNSPKSGFINRVGKRLFFEQNRKYYAGVLTKWLLLYPNGMSDLKPATYLYINKAVTIDNLSETNKKKLYLFQINYFNNKKYLFQTQTEKDLCEWIKILNDLRETNYREEISSIIPSQGLSIRKLPTPPPDPNLAITSTTNKVNDDKTASVTVFESDHNENQRSSSRSEDIYEEPKSLFDYNNLLVSDNKMICYVNGKKIEYDIPKSQPVSPQQSVQNTPEHKPSQDIDVTDTVQNDETYELIELSKVREKIENELVLLKEKPKLPAKKKLFETCTSQQTTITTSSSGRTPVKQWFKNRLTLSSSKETTQILSISSPKLIPSPAKSPSKVRQNATGIGVEKSPPKGAKINMIINQLEANGHLPLISKNLNERRNTMLYEDYITVGK